MAFILSHGVSHGARGGVAVALGIFVADLLLTALTATGVSAAFSTWPPSFDVLRYLGALYLMWMAVQAIRQRGAARFEQARKSSLGSVSRLATLNSLLNPKALLFFIVFLPQFVVPANGSVAIQLATLGVILSVIALVFHCALGVASGRIGTLLGRWPAAARYLDWLHASIFVGLAARLLLLDKSSGR